MKAKHQLDSRQIDLLKRMRREAEQQRKRAKEYGLYSAGPDGSQELLLERHWTEIKAWINGWMKDA